MMQKHRTSTGSAKPEDLKEARVLYSDELECFEIFKEKTGGVIHQHKRVEVTEYNQNFVAQQCKWFQVNPVQDEVPAETKKGKKPKQRYTYYYFGKEYLTLKSLNKHGVYITLDIHFDTLLDIIPYYPYVVSMSSCDKDHQEIYIADKSEVITERDNGLKYGYLNMWEFYTKALQRHYLAVCEDYYFYRLNERIRLFPVKSDNLQVYDDQYYCITIPEGVDYLHEINYIWSDNKRRSYWTSPVLKDYNKILLHKSDVEDYLKDDIANGALSVRYVEKCTFPLYLG